MHEYFVSLENLTASPIRKTGLTARKIVTFQSISKALTGPACKYQLWATSSNYSKIKVALTAGHVTLCAYSHFIDINKKNICLNLYGNYFRNQLWKDEQKIYNCWRVSNTLYITSGSKQTHGENF